MSSVSDRFPIVETENLSKVVQTAEGPLSILREVTFSVMPRETAAIVGASGSGKSTLLGLLAGLDRPSAGSVRISGQDLFSLDEEGRAALRGRMIGFVFQAFQLLPSLTALENVMMPLELRRQRNAESVARQLLDRVGLADRLSHTPRQLSGGEQQRVAIARAFAGQPPILLADEPTGNLDADTGVRVIDLLFEMNREHGTTLIVVTHDRSLADRCGRRFELTRGSMDMTDTAWVARR